MLVGLLVLLVAGVVLSLYCRAIWENPRYADQVFAELPHDAVLATRRWHPRDGRIAWDCTFAVVRLLEDAPAEPPAMGRSREWHLRWGTRDWVPTPVWAPCENCRDAISTCSEDLDADTAARIRRAVAEPGSWAQDEGGAKQSRSILRPNASRRASATATDPLRAGPVRGLLSRFQRVERSTP